MPHEMTLDQKIALVEIELDSHPDWPEDIKHARRSQLLSLKEKRAQIIRQECVELEYMTSVRERPYPHFNLLTPPSIVDMIGALVRKFLGVD